MKANVNQDICIGCGACTVIASEVFEFNDNGLAQVKDVNLEEVNQDELEDACNSCPVSAISIEK